MKIVLGVVLGVVVLALLGGRVAGANSSPRGNEHTRLTAEKAGPTVGLGPTGDTGPSLVAETYVIPNSDATQDGWGYVVVHGPSSSRRTSLGRLTEVGLRASPGGFIGTSFSHGASSGSFFAIPNAAFRPGRLIPTWADEPVVGCDGTHYFVQVGSSIHVLSSSGVLLRTIKLKTRTATAPTPIGSKAFTAPGPGFVAAYVTAADGEEYAVLDTLAGIVVMNLVSGQERTIPAYTSTLDATFSQDGHLVILAASPNDPTGSVQLLWVDPSSLSVQGSADTGVSPSHVSLDGYQVLNTASHGLFVFLASYDGSTTTDRLWHADPSDMSLSPATQLPDNVGISAAVGSDDTLYFFNGPARNVVLSWNPSDDTFTPDEPSLDGPAGSYLTGLAFLGHVRIAA
ncbi:MAG: hypothetical protein QOG85_2573 [Gaiellaceae bacterium]|nr:hypothetical protein [Gaiellaceae bacterium]